MEFSPVVQHPSELLSVRGSDVKGHGKVSTPMTSPSILSSTEFH